MKRRAEETAKLQIRIPSKLKAEAEVAAEAAGQLMSVFVTRAINAHVLRAKDDARPERAISAALKSAEAGKQ